jgi:hypothetical protein
VRVRVPLFISLLLLTCSVVAALAWAPGAHAKRHPAFRHTKVAAERNVLRSPIFFLRRGGRGATLVDPRTKLFRTNVAVVCSGRKRQHRAHTFTCVVRYEKVRVRVRYIATGARAFRLARAG